MTNIDQDTAILVAQLRKYVLEPLFSPGFALAVRNAAADINELANLIAPEPFGGGGGLRPRITTNLGNVHKRYRRPRDRHRSC